MLGAKYDTMDPKYMEDGYRSAKRKKCLQTEAIVPNLTTLKHISPH
jgi:hypothetical protein